MYYSNQQFVILLYWRYWHFQLDILESIKSVTVVIDLLLLSTILFLVGDRELSSGFNI